MPPVHKRLHIHLDTTEAAPGETVLVEAETPALPLLPHLKRAFLKRGAYPLFRLGYPGEARDFLLHGGRWLEAIPEVERALYEKADKFLRVLSALDLRGLHLHR
jgi:aminopeptidase